MKRKKCFICGKIKQCKRVQYGKDRIWECLTCIGKATSQSIKKEIHKSGFSP